jgi:Queuine tRNA-ribosyltransferase
MKRSLKQQKSEYECESSSEVEGEFQRQSPIRLLLHTKDGIIPYLTPTLLQKYFPAPQTHLCVGIAVREYCSKPLFPSKDSTKPNGYAFSSPGADNSILDYHRLTVPTFDLIQDSIGKTAATSNGNLIMVWTPHGRQPLTTTVYRSVSKSLQSNATVSLFDMALDDDSKKRQQVAARRTSTWWQAHQEEDANVLAPIVLVGTQDQFPLGIAAGYVFIGLQHITPRHVRNQRISNILNKCDPTKMHVALSCRSVQQMLDVIRMGIDTVGASLPTEWALTQRAFACQWTGDIPTTKRVRTDMVLDQDGCFDVGNVDFCRDARPLVEGCTCMACQQHSRAYIHHLLLAKELLAQILLFTHNLTRLIELCQHATRARDEKRLETFCDSVEQQLGLEKGC